MTFDGDVTLYNDGESLLPDNPVISRIIGLLERGIKVGIVTAAGYTDTSKYYGRLSGLLDAVNFAVTKGVVSSPTLIVLGGESNYLFTFDKSSKYLLKHVARENWMLDEMKLWAESDISALLDTAEKALSECIINLGLDAEILRKERAVGIIPVSNPTTSRFAREQLEETVLVTQQIVEMSPAGKRLPFCAFNGKHPYIIKIIKRRAMEANASMT